ncbi:MAG: segregation/condensation protein A [Syntrophomonadaceae bacterium]|jgi:segregation and condensation protein A|nr:segregation/condensation protein A [Syntrophomonadaceae bacterium]
MAYMVDLETFHGPLDLLLYLVEKNQVDIYDIPIAVITEQYLEYLQSSGDFDLERMGDFLIMASYLLNLKSRFMLPDSLNETEEEEDNIDPRQELVEKLLAYKRFKEAAVWLEERYNGREERIYYREEQQDRELPAEWVADLKSLVKAYHAVIKDISEDADYYELPQGDVNVGDKMEEIINRLKKKPHTIIFQDLFLGIISKREALALFLALLELIRLQRVEALQNTPFDKIELRLRAAI